MSASIVVYMPERNTVAYRYKGMSDEIATPQQSIIAKSQRNLTKLTNLS